MCVGVIDRMLDRPPKKPPNNHEISGSTFFREKFSFERTSSSWKGDLVALSPTNRKGITIDEITSRYAVQAIFVISGTFLSTFGTRWKVLFISKVSGARTKYENVT